MKLFKAIVILSLLAADNIFAQNMPFTKGVNLTNWFQTPSARQVQFNKYTKKDFENIKSLGCDVIRLPINLHYMTNGAPDYEIDPLFYTFMDQVVDWAEELQIHLILDNHTFDPSGNTDPAVRNILLKVWPRVAAHYKDRSNFIYYEVLNEPHGISDEEWNDIQKNVVTAIRAVDAKHTIIVGPANWNSFHNLDKMPVFDDDNLIYTFHFYEPFLFTHQGASWVSPSMEPLTGVPYPYNADSMPPLPENLKGSWIESAYNNYHTAGTEQYVRDMIDTAAQFMAERNVPLFCGEMGVYMQNSKNNDRIFWYKTVREYMDSLKIPYTMWDYRGGFGLFEKDSYGMFEHDLNVPLLQALGWNVPEQTDFILKPDTTGFMIYTDYLYGSLQDGSYGTGTLDFYAADKPNNGDFCLKWGGGSSLYDNVLFNFMPPKDMTQLVAGGYALNIFVRSDYPDMEFDIRFIDTKEGPADHPWRMQYSVDKSKVAWDSKWHKLYIPLSDFVETGSWDDGWYNPEGKFDWSKIGQFVIANDAGALEQGRVWFDNIYVTDQDTARIWETTEFPELVTALEDQVRREIKIFPNPATNHVTIAMTSEMPSYYYLYNAQGKEIAESRFKGEADLDVSGLRQGIYLLKIHDDKDIFVTRKILIE